MSSRLPTHVHVPRLQRLVLPLARTSYFGQNFQVCLRLLQQLQQHVTLQPRLPPFGTLQLLQARLEHFGQQQGLPLGTHRHGLHHLKPSRHYPLHLCL